MSVSHDIGTIWKEQVVDYFKALYENFPGETEEKSLLKINRFQFWSQCGDFWNTE
jgi:hypothetical protein